jgi:predicted O-methyltransferase YrrM
MSIAQGIYRRVLPAPIRYRLNRAHQARALERLKTATCDAANLRHEVPDLASVAAEEWERVQAVTAQLGLGDLLGAVNHGDRCAIYQLARALRARDILEVGTHLGASTAMLGLAQKQNGGGNFVTVDIADVNGPGGAWRQNGCPFPPREVARALGIDVRFIVSPSIWYLGNTKARFDLIFLDGGHEAATVYTEIPLALALLKPGGLILLHDVYPDEQPLWDDGFVVPGPWMALERFKAEDAPIRVVPLGALPWPTKKGSNVTSLAYLCHR